MIISVMMNELDIVINQCPAIQRAISTNRGLTLNKTFRVNPKKYH